MPESYIIHRYQHEGDGSTDKWWAQVCSLSDWEQDIFKHIIHNHLFRTVNRTELTRGVKDVLDHYIEQDVRKKSFVGNESKYWKQAAINF